MPNTSALRSVAAALCATTLGGCYVVPVTPEGPHHAIAPAYVVPAPVYTTPGAAPPASFPARLYPSNEIATRTGVLTGTVTNMMTGKGVFQLDYHGEVLSGEATHVAGDPRRGVASAYGPRGTCMDCEYRMNTPYQGIGTCRLSTGAQYNVHIGG